MTRVGGTNRLRRCNAEALTPVIRFPPGLGRKRTAYLQPLATSPDTTSNARHMLVRAEVDVAVGHDVSTPCARGSRRQLNRS